MYLDDYHHQLAIFSVPEGWVDSEGEDTVPRHDVGLHHLAFEVADQAAFDDAVAYIRSREDIEVVWGPLRLDESNGLWGGHEGIYFLDPGRQPHRGISRFGYVSRQPPRLAG